MYAALKIFADFTGFLCVCCYLLMYTNFLAVFLTVIFITLMTCQAGIYMLL